MVFNRKNLKCSLELQTFFDKKAKRFCFLTQKASQSMKLWYRGLGFGTIWKWERRAWSEFRKFRKIEKERKCSGRPSKPPFCAKCVIAQAKIVYLGTIEGLLSKNLKNRGNFMQWGLKYSDLFARASRKAEHMCHFRLIVSEWKKNCEAIIKTTEKY